MIAEVLPTTDIVVTAELMEHDCLEQVVRAAERAAIEAHRVAVETYTARALFLADRAHDHLRQVQEAREKAIGTCWWHGQSATRARNRAWFAATYAREAGLCERQARTLGRRLAQLEARWEAGAGG